MGKILIDEKILRKYIDGSLKYDALIEYNVINWPNYYDALDIYKNEEYDISKATKYTITNYSKLVDREIEFLKEAQYNYDEKRDANDN